MGNTKDDMMGRVCGPALLALLRAGLWEREVERLACFPLSPDEWEAVFRAARRQTVTGLVFRGVQHLPEGLLPPLGLLVRWMAEVDAIERRNLEMNRALAELYSACRLGELNPVLQKGQGVALCYERPLLRECGDIDLYFNSSRTFDVALHNVRARRLRVRRGADRSAYYHWRGVVVEHHSRLLDSYNPFQKDYVGELERRHGYSRASLPAGPSSVQVTVPSPFLNLLLLDLHILKHALGRGIGLRQLCDMARVCYRFHGLVDAAEMKEACGQLGLDGWNPLLHAFLTECLGLPAACLPYPEVAPSARPLADIVRRGGNFGHHAPGAGEADDPAFLRKWHTVRSFRGNVRFAFHYAPKEAFWIFTDLLKGQLR